MKNMSLLEAWQNGQSMLAALLSFANAEERAATINEEPNLFWSLAQGLTDAKVLADREGISFEEAASIKRNQNENELKMRQSVIARIHEKFLSGHLAAIGFEPPRQMTSVAIDIPVEYLRQSIDWKRNEVSYESLRFVDVRVVTKSTLMLSEADVPTSTKAGRKSREQIYFACFTALEKHGQLDPAKSINTAFPAVRAWLSKEYPETFPTPSVGSDKTIYRYFNAFRNLSKVKYVP